MTPQTQARRIGWFAALAICTALYLLLHLKVHSVRSDVIRAERQIVQLEEQNLLLETEFLTRSSQVQLARWNRVDFGYAAPTADQFIESERQLASFGSPRAPDAPEPIRLAGAPAAADVPPFPKLVSPITGRPLDDDLVLPGADDSGPTRIALGLPGRPLRIDLSAMVGTAAQ